MCSPRWGYSSVACLLGVHKSLDSMSNLPYKPHMHTLIYYYLPPKKTFSQIHSSITKGSIWQFWSLKVGNTLLRSFIVCLCVCGSPASEHLSLPCHIFSVQFIYALLCHGAGDWDFTMKFYFQDMKFKGPVIKVLKVFQYTFYVVTKEKLRNTIILSSFDCYNNCQHIWIEHDNGCTIRSHKAYIMEHHPHNCPEAREV